MKKGAFANSVGNIIIILCLLLISVAAISIIRKNNPTEANNSSNQPTPNNSATTINIPSPNPIPVNVAPIIRSEERVFSKIVDLSGNLPDTEKTVVIIKKADGTYAEYIIPSDTVIVTMDDLRSFLNLDEGDILDFHYPLVSGIPIMNQTGTIIINPTLSLTDPWRAGVLYCWQHP